MPENPTPGDVALDVDTLPPLPATAGQLLELLVDPDVDVTRLATVIERDPPLSARLVGIANSAYYAPRQPVTTVKSAIVGVLGLNVVRNVTFGLAIAGGLKLDRVAGFDLGVYWVMALGTADMASGLARVAGTPEAPDPDELYLSGLLHNLGELLLAHRWPERVGEVAHRLQQETGATRESLERDIIGVDRWTAGSALARHWQLPAFVAEDMATMMPERVPGSLRARLLRASRDWVAGVASGQPAMLRVGGLDETHCDYRSNDFLDRFDGLASMARSLA